VTRTVSFTLTRLAPLKVRVPRPRSAARAVQRIVLAERLERAHNGPGWGDEPTDATTVFPGIMIQHLRATSRAARQRRATYVCPDCKSPLVRLSCAPCAHTYTAVDRIPVLLSRDPRFDTNQELVDAYDDIYSGRANVWENQGRTLEFIQGFAALLKQFAPQRLLEVGCGEGYLLAAVNADEKFAVDLSAQALRQARTRTSAQYSVALAERLPFPTAYFDVVISVGVMEHFLDDHEATKEIWRVLRPGGYYVALIHVDSSFRERLAQKCHEYLYPRFRPVALIRWISGKVLCPIRQPIQRRYTAQSGRTCLEECGFTITRVASRTSAAGLSLIGPHVIVYIARK
jgi:ubiquinone/menaquinone biosynthesis C-methylase UbiE